MKIEHHCLSLWDWTVLVQLGWTEQIRDILFKAMTLRLLSLITLQRISLHPSKSAEQRKALEDVWVSTLECPLDTLITHIKNCILKIYYKMVIIWIYVGVCYCTCATLNWFQPVIVRIVTSCLFILLSSLTSHLRALTPSMYEQHLLASSSGFNELLFVCEWPNA